jgi:hypothetical protein
VLNMADLADGNVARQRNTETCLLYVRICGCLSVDRVGDTTDESLV